MAITDRTRKILWAWSGNQCAMCSQMLIEEATAKDPEAVVGRECHIVSGKERGPRYDPEFPQSKVDDIANLLLLCPTHHAIVDAQDSTYTADQLREVKETHESRMRAQREGVDFPPEIRFIRSKDAIPKKLKCLTTGRELVQLVESDHAMYFDYPPVRTQEDADLFAGFGRELEDWGMLLSDGEAHVRVEAELALGNLVNELLSHDCAIFGAMEKQRVEGGIKGSSDWYVSHLTIARIDDPAIVWEQSAQDTEAEDEQPPTG